MLPLQYIQNAPCSVRLQPAETVPFILQYLKLKNHYGRKQQSETGLSH